MKRATKKATRKRAKKIPRENSHRVEDVPAKELTVEHIAKVHAAFERTFEKNGGYKGYDVQAIGALLATIAELDIECAAMVSRNHTLVAQLVKRIYLPKITPEIEAEHFEWMERDNEGQLQWKQEAVDFACMLKSQPPLAGELTAIDRIRDIMETNDPTNAREIFGKPRTLPAETP